MFMKMGEGVIKSAGSKSAIVRWFANWVFSARNRSVVLVEC